MQHFQHHHHHTITIWVFHKHYYDDEAQVKCSLSRSDGDLNRFLSSWWFTSHINHASPVRVTLVTKRTILVKSWVRQAPPYLGVTRLLGRTLVSTSCPRGLLNQLQYGTYIRSIPSPISVPASWSEQVIFLVKCGTRIPHSKRTVNDWSLIDTDRTTMVQNLHKALPNFNLFLNTWLWTITTNLLPTPLGNHL